MVISVAFMRYVECHESIKRPVAFENSPWNWLCTLLPRSKFSRNCHKCNQNATSFLFIQAEYILLISSAPELSMAMHAIVRQPKLTTHCSRCIGLGTKVWHGKNCKWSLLSNVFPARRLSWGSSRNFEGYIKRAGKLAQSNHNNFHEGFHFTTKVIYLDVGQ